MTKEELKQQVEATFNLRGFASIGDDVELRQKVQTGEVIVNGKRSIQTQERIIRFNFIGYGEMSGATGEVEPLVGYELNINGEKGDDIWMRDASDVNIIHIK